MLGGCFSSEELVDNLRKADPHESVSLDCFAFVRWYVDHEVSMESEEEAERLVCWGCKARLMYTQREIFLKVN